MTAATAHPAAAAWLAVSAERDRWTRLALAAERDAYARGRADGYAAGYADGYADCDAGWMWALEPARDAARRAASTPTHAETERVRWAVRGQPRTRATYGRPHPGDYPGGAA